MITDPRNGENPFGRSRFFSEEFAFRGEQDNVIDLFWPFFVAGA